MYKLELGMDWFGNGNWYALQKLALHFSIHHSISTKSQVVAVQLTD